MATIPIFDGTNYKFWSVKMRTLFLSMDLWDTVQYGYDETNKEKQQKDAAALSHIQQGVSDRIFRIIEDATKAKQAWDILSQLSTEERIPIFDGTNYEPWSVRMINLFISKDLWDTVQEINRGNAQKDAAALFHIQQFVSERIFPKIEDATKAKQAWDILFRLSTERPTRLGFMNVIRSTPIDLRQTRENHLIVATLVATVTFTAGFTMPGGYNGNDGPNQGMAILTREAAFKAFMVTDALAMSLSVSAVLIHFFASMTNNRDQAENLLYIAAYLISYAAIAMVLAFVTGTYAVLAHSSGLAISVCVIGCFPLPFFLITDIMDKLSYRAVYAIIYLSRYEPRGRFWFERARHPNLDQQ